MLAGLLTFPHKKRLITAKVSLGQLAQLKNKAVVVVRAALAQQAVAITRQLWQAGFKAVEITTPTPGFLEALQELAAEKPAGALLGLGTVLQPGHWQAALALGVDFMASPVLLLPAMACAQEAETLFLPGIATPTEYFTAAQAGALAVKVFPAKQLGGAGFLKALQGPFTTQSLGQALGKTPPALIPFGGVEPEEAQAYFKAGAWAVGLGSALMPNATNKTGPLFTETPPDLSYPNQLKKALLAIRHYQ